MTIAEFMKALERTPRKGWMLREGGHAIRRALPAGDRCPIEVVAKAKVDDAENAARRLGLSETARDRIICAADGFREPALRKRLLRAVGLKEVDAV